MKKLVSFLAFLLFLSIIMTAQSLEFSRVLIVSNSLETVAADKVWKVTSVYGQKFACWPMSCPGSWPNNSIYATRSGFKVNGVNVTVFNSTFNASAGIYYEGTSCTGGQSAGGPVTSCLNAGYGDYINPIPDRQTILPLWLPAGTTLQSFDSSIYLSVIEFNIVP